MNMQMQTQQPHKNAHIPIPTEEGLEMLVKLIYQNRHNPEQLAFLESEIPPHIMEAAAEYSERKAEEEERLTNEAKQLTNEVKNLRIQMQNLRQSIKKRMDSQQQKPTNS